MHTGNRARTKPRTSKPAPGRPAIYRVRIQADDEAEADAISDALGYALFPETSAVGMIETDKGWFAEAFYTDEPEEAAIRAILERATGRPAANRRIVCEALADRNWVKDSLEALPPVFAGRFAVFGHHDKARIPANAIPIEIEAGQAFGTGHHGTTLGCLTALDRLSRRGRFTRPLDVGCGTGVLAIAAAKLLRVPVAATDIDPIAVALTRENAAKNGVAALVRAVTADGVGAQAVKSGAPYDLVLANILAKPLVALAPAIRPLMARGTVVILSGLLTTQRREVEAAWRARGCVPMFRIVLDGWATLVLEVH
ncbi:50S ribosomal protein L11 methyltransferase [Microbaculum marinum]|uniref:Ribosomal protein L11 methyltransferase n=1 Tax=Microbaculum marinum TaxID=1764581 RepID=A0AAW9RKK9_9HYPH